ncbi:MAG: efflux RND transporter periplasmic adaptor subunit [Gammaproteobacteria bacterium]
MIRTHILGFILVLTATGLAQANTSLDLTPADLERLGVTLQVPEAVAEAEVASAPAMVVIPPAQEAVVTSTVGGVVSRLLVAEGDFVTAGQPLAEIVSTELLELQREFVEAALAADLAQAQAERDQSLHADGIIAERRVLESAAALRSAVTVLEQTRQQLTLAGMNESELARLRQGRVLSPNLRIEAPFAATVVEQHSALGAHVDALDPVYRVADLSELWLELRVPQERADRIRPGMRVAVSTADRRLLGEVSLIGRVTDAATQTVLVRARIEDEGGRLRAGQVLAARVLDASIVGSETLAVPSAAIVRSDDGIYVFGTRQGELMIFPVEVLGQDGTRTYIRGDFGTEVRVVIGGTASLKSVWLSAEDEGE